MAGNDMTMFTDTGIWENQLYNGLFKDFFL